MIVLDTSALVAVLGGEPAADAFNETIAAADGCLLSAANYVEVHIVIESRHGEVGTRELALYLHESGTVVVPVDRDLADLARIAFREFGKGRHEAALNFGDCYSYALAKRVGAPLLFKGEDFSKTDLLSA